MKDIRTYLAIAAAAIAAIFYFLWQNTESQVQSWKQGPTITKIETTLVNIEWQLGPSDTIEVPVSRTLYKTIPVPTGTLSADHDCDSIRFHAFSRKFGDTLQIFDSLKVKGRLLDHKLGFTSNIPIRTREIRTTQTNNLTPWKHRLYLNGATDFQGAYVGVTYSSPNWEAGYQTDPFRNRHKIRLGVNTIAIFRELFNNQ